MPRHVQPIPAAPAKKAAAPAAAARPRAQPAGPQRGPLWHAIQLRAARSALDPVGPSALPAPLKAGIEQLSGSAMDDVRVHRDSPEPGKLGALAFAKGSDIHLGRGQERHLPHEAWHVVQQKQKRVRATTQLKGAPVNDDPELEREADAMGSLALASAPRAGDPRRPLEARPVAPGPAPIQGIWVKRKIGKGKDAVEGPYILADEKDVGAVDTRTMKVADRESVLKDLGSLQGGPAKKARDALAEEIRLMSGSLDEKEITGLGDSLAALQQAFARGPLDAKARLELESISFTVVRALSMLREADEEDKTAAAMQLLLESHVKQINALDAKALSSAINLAEADVDLNVTVEDVAAYRADIAARGTWGSGAEASIIATAFNFRCRLLILDSHNRYVLVDTIGPPNGNARTRSLLNTGNHYQIVSNAAQPGGAFNDNHVLYNPRGDGDCLFRALHDVAAAGGNTVNDNVAPNTPLDEEAFIARARAIASAGLTTAQIENSIVEIRNSRSRFGLGPRLRARMNIQDLSDSELRARFERTGKGKIELLQKVQEALTGTPFQKWANGFGSFEELIKGYDGLRTTLLEEPEDVSAKSLGRREKDLGLANDLRDRLLTVIALNLPKTESSLVESQGQDVKAEARLRRESLDNLKRTEAAMIVSPHNQDQIVVTLDKKDFVMDRIGQLVPRIVHRGISDFNQAELDTEQQMFPTKLSPLADEKSKYDDKLKAKFGKEASVSASGIGANKIKASLEMQHVEGVKPSPFLSTTAIQGGTINPQGKSFGKAAHEIDLAYLPPSVIAATYTDRGMGYFLLSAFEGTQKEKAALVANARIFEEKQGSKEGYSAEKAATADKTLSGKEWQALMDVIRTEEILISAPVPREAIISLGKK